jgi:hypothetical protein
MADIGGLPDTEDAAWWFLLNIVGLPVGIVTILASLAALSSWIKASHGAVRHGTQVMKTTASAVRAGRWSALTGAILSQSGLVVVSWVLGILYENTLSVLNSNQSWDTTQVLSSAFFYNHSTPFMSKVTLGAVVLVLWINFEAVFGGTIFILILVAAWALGVLASAISLLMSLGALYYGFRHLDQFTPGMAGLFCVWFGAIGSWTLLLYWSLDLQIRFFEHPKRDA